MHAIDPVVVVSVKYFSPGDWREGIEVGWFPHQLILIIDHPSIIPGRF